MITTNFAVAVVAVVVKRLVSKFLIAFQTPPVAPLLSATQGMVLVSGTLCFIYHRLRRGQKMQLTYRNQNCRHTKVLNGRIRKNNSSSSIKNVRQRKRQLPARVCWTRKSAARSRCSSNLLSSVKSSVQTLHENGFSTASLSSESTVSPKCQCQKDPSVEQSLYFDKDPSVPKESTPSVYTIKSDSDGVLVDKILNKKKIEKQNRLNGRGDCTLEQRLDKNVKPLKTRQTRTTRKTRSGRVYSYYL